MICFRIPSTWYLGFSLLERLKMVVDVLPKAKLQLPSSWPERGRKENIAGSFNCSQSVTS